MPTTATAFGCWSTAHARALHADGLLVVRFVGGFSRGGEVLGVGWLGLLGGRTASGLGTSLRATSSAARTASATLGSVEVSNQPAMESSSCSGRDTGMSSVGGS